MKSTLLVIGDLYLDEVKKAPSICKFIRYKKEFLHRKIGFQWIPYDDVLLRRLPVIKTKRIKIMLFFPYAHWNSHIERYDKDRRIYGDNRFGGDFKKFFQRVETILKSTYKDKEISYVNPPRFCVLDRNKIATSRFLKKKGILTPKIYNVKNITQLNRILKRSDMVYIKPVFGAMGKGISVVTKNDCFTNYIYRGGRLVSRPEDINWKFIKISKKRRQRFLNILIRKGFLFEEGIKMPLARRRRFDVRVHVISGKVAFMFARSAAKGSYITNWSQGGRMESERFLKKFIPPHKLEEVKRLSKKTAEIFSLNYAGIDVILDRDFKNIYIVEVHSFPGNVRRFNLMKVLAEAIS